MSAASRSPERRPSLPLLCSLAMGCLAASGACDTDPPDPGCADAACLTHCRTTGAVHGRCEDGACVCFATWEGDDPGECRDGADNDRDGLFDCDDDGCLGSADCEPADADATDDADDAADGEVTGCGNGIVEIGEDCDSDPPVGCTTTCGTPGVRVCEATTCRWSECRPRAETCDGIDNDCDTTTDEDCP